MPRSVSNPVMVGRAGDLAELRGAFERALEGAPTAVLIEGEAGIGKSRLLREFQDEIAARADVHAGWCLDLGATRMPYGPLVAILRSLVALLGVEDTLAAVGVGSHALRMLVPELADGAIERERTSPEGLRDAIATLIEGAAARAPQVILIEDLHWADDSTLAILSFLLRALTRGRILLVISCRTDDVRRGDSVSRFIGEASRARVLERISVRRLDAAATRELAEQLSGRVLGEAALERMLERAEGVPFFIEELASCTDGPLPDSLRDLLLTRYDRLDDDARRVIRVASGADGPLSHSLLARLAGLDDDRLDGGIREATRSGILSVDEEHYSFRHALQREAVHGDLLPGERARLHRAFAEALEEDRVDPLMRCDRAALAYHWHLARDARRALDASVSAMMQAKASYAFASAARFGELALELWDQVPDAEAAAGVDRISLLGRLGSILRNAGNNERSLAVVDLALAEIDPRSADQVVYARLLRDKAEYVANLGRPGSIELFIDALTVLEPVAGEDRLRASILNRLASRYMVAGMVHEAIITSTEAYDAAERVEETAEMSVARNVRGTCRAHLGDVEGALADFAVAGELSDARGSELRYRVNYSDTLSLLGRYRDAVEVAEAGYTRAKQLGVERSSGAVMLQNMIEPLLALGKIDQVEELLARTPAVRSQRVFDQYMASSRVRALAWRGKHAEAEALRQEWWPILRSTGELERQIWYYAVEMESAVAVARGEWEQALAVILRMLGDPGPTLGHHRRLLLESGWVIAELRARGTDTIDAARTIRSEWDQAPASLRDSRWEGILDALLEPDLDRLAEAVTLADQDDVPTIMRAVTRLEHARLLVADGDRASAGPVLAEAAGIAESLGHTMLRQTITEFGSASGLHAGAGSDGSLDLTARERQVLDLIADGLSNKQIGERLFISAKTASVHVSAILRKLGVATRTEAALLASRSPR